jgi:hypothetical protein
MNLKVLSEPDLNVADKGVTPSKIHHSIGINKNEMCVLSY